MNELDKLLELLEKDSLSSAESEALIRILDNHPEAKKIKDIYTRLVKAFNKDGHIDDELMGEYVLHLHNNSSDKIVTLLSAKIEEHLRNCSKCEELFKLFNSEYTEVDQFVSESIKDKSEKNVLAFFSDIKLTQKISSLRYIAGTIATLAIIYVGLMVSDSILTPIYKKSFFNGNEFYVTRGRTTESFQKALTLIDSKDYENAVKYLKEDIDKNPNSESLFYAHYVLGLTYISKAETDFIGFFPSYDREDVIEGINNLKKSIELNKFEDFENIKLNAYYFLGKAYLLINETDSAKVNLSIVIEGRGGYYKQAEDLLKQMNN